MNVIDTSVVLKWYVREEGSDRAAALLGNSLIAPDLLMAELANAFWKKAFRNELPVEQGMDALREAALAIELMPLEPLAQRAFEISAELGHPAYDCFYLSLAERHGISLITADERFVRACAGSRYVDRLMVLETES